MAQVNERMKKLLRSAIVFLLAACLPGPLLAQVQSFAPQRGITVIGESHRQIAPDQAILSMTLLTRDDDLSAAKRTNDAQAKRLVALARQLEIPEANVANSNVYIAPNYEYDPKDGSQRQNGYTVSRSVRVTMDRLDIHERLLSAIVEAKIDQVNGIEFRLAHPERHAGALRLEAFADAKEKAAQIAQAAGARLGPAMTINVDDASTSVPAPPRPMMMMAKAESTDSSVAPSLPGTVELREAVTVTFALE